LTLPSHSIGKTDIDIAQHASLKPIKEIAGQMGRGKYEILIRFFHANIPFGEK